jgi:hypothetical protein
MDQKAKEMFEQYQSGMQGTPVLTSGGMNPASRQPLSAHGSGAPQEGATKVNQAGYKVVFHNGQWGLQ